MALQQFIGNLRQSPVWLADFANRDHMQVFPAKLDVTAFSDAAGVPIAVSGAAAQNATSVPVAALTPSVLANTTLIGAGQVIIPSGSVVYFGGAKVAQLTADAKIGDTALTVAALPTALAGTETATYSPYGTLAVPSGTIVSRTYAQRDAITPYHAAVSTDDELFIVAYDCPNIRQQADCELVRWWTTVRENYLPQYGTGLALGTSGSPTALLTALRLKYRCIVGNQ